MIYLTFNGIINQLITWGTTLCESIPIVWWLTSHPVGNHHHPICMGGNEEHDTGKTISCWLDPALSHFISQQGPYKKGGWSPIYHHSTSLNIHDCSSNPSQLYIYILLMFISLLFWCIYLYIYKTKHVISPHGPLLNPPFHPIIGGQIQPMNTHATKLYNSAA